MNCPKILTNGHISSTKQLPFTRDFSSPRPSPPKHQSCFRPSFYSPKARKRPPCLHAACVQPVLQPKALKSLQMP